MKALRQVGESQVYDSMQSYLVSIPYNSLDKLGWVKLQSEVSESPQRTNISAG